MAKPYFRINGVDILRYTIDSGIEWSRNDVESPNAGRTMDATMHRGRVAIKFKANVTCLPLNRDDEIALMELILPEFVEVETNMHPLYAYHYARYYSNNVPATVATADPDTGEIMWTGISFPLIEQ